MTDEQIGQALQQLPPEVQYAIVHCMPNVAYGANWGLCRIEDVKKVLPEIKANRNLFALPVRGKGVVLQISDGYLETMVSSALKGVITNKDIIAMREKQARAVEDLEKYFKRLDKKDDKGVKTVGIFCTNLTPNIRYNDVDYPAFRVDFNLLLKVLNKYNYGVVLTDGTNKSLVNAEILGSYIQSNLEVLSKSLIMSPTSTGVFIKIKKL